jgi:impB/mucB/samB family C-terminal domain
MDRRFRGFAQIPPGNTVRRQSAKIPRDHTLREPTHLAPIVFETMKILFARHCDRTRKVRLVGVAISSFTHGGEQLDLLDASRREKQECLAQATDALRDRFGFSKIQFGGSISKAQRDKVE